MNYIITSKTITVNFDNQTHTVDRNTVEYDKIVQCIKDKNFEEIPNIISVANRLKKFSNGGITIEDGKVLMDGEELPTLLSDRILDFESQSLPYDPLVNFWSNLKKNPSYRARNQLFNFLEHNGHPITEDGCFIAYKGVRSDFTDCHTGTFDNSIGKVVTMPREQVDDDPTHTCSAGLHVASYSYAHDFTSDKVVVECKINPADVVSVPVDYNGEKMRVCAYQVIGISKGERKEIYHSSNYQDKYSCEESCDDCQDCEESCDDPYCGSCDDNCHCDHINY